MEKYEDWVCSACKQEFDYEDYENVEFDENDFFNKYIPYDDEEIVLCQSCAEEVADQVQRKKHYKKARFWSRYPVWDKIVTYGFFILGLLLLGCLLSFF